MINTPSQILKYIKMHSNSIQKEFAPNYDLSDLLRDIFKEEKNIKIHIGCTKCAIVPENNNFVLKCNYHYNYYCSDEYFPNYCDREYENYTQASLYGYDIFLAPIKKSICLNIKGLNVQFYIQDKVYIDEEAERKDSELSNDKELTSARLWSDSTWDLSLSWIQNFLNVYSFEDYKDLFNFLDEYDINDIHEGNIGYLNNKPVIFDYSGYAG